MATTKQKQAARRNITKARAVQSTPAQGKKTPRRSDAMRTAENPLSDKAFAFPAERKEPLTDAAHVRNAIARFDQVEGVSDAERDRAWRRITAAAKNSMSRSRRAIGASCSEGQGHEALRAPRRTARDPRTRAIPRI